MNLERMDLKTFQDWLARMDDAIDEFLARLPGDVRARLDYTVDSLDVLEAWLLERYSTTSKELPQGEAPIFDGAARYVGEVIRKYIGGRWEISLDDPKYVYHGLPELSGFRSDGAPDCPATFVTASLHRRRGDFISSFLRKQLDILSGAQPPKDPLLLRMARRFKIVTTEEDSFKYWLSLMDSALDELAGEMPEELTSRLDHSADSLKALEAWLLERFPDVESARAYEAVLTLDGVSRYVGETFRQLLDGEWWFDLDGWSHNGLPQIRWSGGNICPLALAHTAIERREGDILHAALSGE